MRFLASPRAQAFPYGLALKNMFHKCVDQAKDCSHAPTSGRAFRIGGELQLGRAAVGGRLLMQVGVAEEPDPRILEAALGQMNHDPL